MTKHKYIRFLPAIALLAVLTTGCSKLNQVSTTSVAAAAMFKDTTSLKEALTGLYSTLEVQPYYGAYYPMLSDLNSDNGIAGGYNNTSLNEFGAYNVTSSNIFVQNTYVALYYTIATANAILAGDKGIPDTAAQTQQTIASANGQALAIRALAHFDLLRAFGYHWDTTSIYGIPVVTTPQTASDVVPRSTVAQTYTAIISDLRQAGSLLSGNASRNPNYINPAIINALLARVYLYKKDYVNAAAYATLVINDGAYSLLDQNNFPSIYTSRNSKESIFELPFNQQNQSGYNISTYARPNAASTEVLFIASQQLQTFFQNRPADQRINLLDYNSSNFQPNGRTLKYSSDISQKDNSAYVIRIPEMYLIRAEALGRSNGLADLNTVLTNRGMTALTSSDVPDDATYAQAIADENRAEFNFEGHRFFDLARTGQIAGVLGVPATNAVWPIPLVQLTATHGAVVQNPGY
ncbi:MAG: RagB/SusD family nutrient uptake outer membrane protein [Chitinophagaceae bacterium]|nr:RagB/SusD family nutrient uptake outer membrane protein [Chitinophagaceae bacterium]